MAAVRVIRFPLVCLLVWLAVGPVAARPAAALTLNPLPQVLFPSAVYSCHTTGTGAICHGTASFDETIPTGLSCPGFPINETNIGTFRFTFFYDQAGNATRITYQDDQSAGQGNTLSNALTGQSVPAEEHVNVTIDFGAPGDFSTATSTFTGLAFFKVTQPGSGVILHDVGIVRVDQTGTVTFVHGPHQFLDALFFGKTNEIQPLCAALS